MSQTSIQWTQHVWNPVVGCSILSPGCTNCYAMQMASRIEAMNAEARERGNGGTAPQYDGTTRKVNGKAVWTGKLAMAGDNILLAPLKRKKPTTYFVNSMSDLFHEDVPDEWIDRVFAVMALCPQHTFQVLTKRAKRMRDYCDANDTPKRIEIEMAAVLEPTGQIGERPPARRIEEGSRRSIFAADPDGSGIFRATGIDPWPLPNVWKGISAERQQEWDERKEYLRQTPAAIHFASFEPLLSAIAEPRPMSDFLQWAIVGGESGPDARPMHPDWARRLRDDCKAAGVPFFLSNGANGHPCRCRAPSQLSATRMAFGSHSFPFRQFMDLAMVKFGKKRAGRRLDGIEHNEMPGVDS